MLHSEWERVIEISIHAPLAGCDLGDTADFIKKIDFNPRTPCGVRPDSIAWKKS